MNIKQGFMLIELIIATAIASFVSIILFTSVNQINRSVRRTSNIMHRDNRAMLFLQQFEHDLLGACIPLIAYPAEKKAGKSKPKEEKKPEKSGEKKAEQKEAGSKQIPALELEPVEDLFYAEIKGPNVVELSFITNNPLPSYETTKPLLTRVTYFLEAEDEKKSIYNLVREESAAQVYEPPTDKNAGHAYELIAGVKSWSLEYIIIKTKQEKDKKPTSELKIIKEWPSKEKDLADYLIPDAIKMSLVLWDDARQRETSYSTIIDLVIRRPAKEEKKEQKNEKEVKKEEKSEKKTETSSQKSITAPIVGAL